MFRRRKNEDVQERLLAILDRIEKIGPGPWEQTLADIRALPER